MAYVCTAIQVLWPALVALLAGAAIALSLGGAVVGNFHRTQKQRIIDRWNDENPERNTEQAFPWLHSSARVDPSLTGNIERTVFALLTIIRPDQVVVAMGIWLGAKMAAHWNRSPIKTDSDSQMWSALAVLALISGILSMSFAGLGGLVAHWLYLVLDH